jgi:hypothetical protein
MFTKNIGMLLLAIWLVLNGLLRFIPSIDFTGLGVVMALLAIVSGILILFEK